MSDHSKPRRWTLCEHKLDHGIEGVGVSLAADEAVPVREDCITEADVETLAKLLAATENGKDPVGDHDPLWAECNAEEKAEWRADAAEFLARIFEGGEQS